MTLLAKIIGDTNQRFLKSLQPIVERINALEPEFAKLSAGALREKTAEFTQRLAGGEPLDDLLAEAFAAVREAARRSIGQRHFDVQLLGGIALHQGKIAEMKTGEGKTLVATLPLYLNSLTGQGCHLVTPNDYLSRVGGGWMGPIYSALGVSVGIIAHEFSGIYDPAYLESPSHGDPRLDHWRPVSRRDAYAADVTYGTNNEFGFDYLRDNMAYALEQMAQLGRRSFSEGGREHHYAIVDEVDSILIDEARTPLIISAPDEESAEHYRTFAKIVPQLKENADYNVDEKMKAVTITEEGIDKVEKLLGISNIYEEKGFRFVRYLEQALRSQALFIRDRDYVVKDGEVLIVDEFTGRLMPGRRWSEGLHQAIEAKEGVPVQRESRTLATITFQNLFRMYEKLAGMTGTAATNAEEFHKVYRMEVVVIPTDKPLIRNDLADFVFRTEHGKFLAAAREIKARHERGQPVLVGTVSIEKNERLSAYLEREGIPHQMLNAKNHEQEALIIAQAGRKGTVTIATNMAGRGVDIILGGSPRVAEGEAGNPIGRASGYSPPVPDEALEVRQAGGLFVLGTERHEARRIDNQLRGRSGRQGDPGETQFFLSLEDDLMRVFGSERIKSMMESFGIPEDQPIENRLVSKSIEAAQGKIEGFHFDARKHILEFDDVMNKHRETVYRMRREVLLPAVPAKISQGEILAGRVGPASGLSAVLQKLEDMIAEEIERLVSFHTAANDSAEWNLEEIAENVRAIAGSPAKISQGETWAGEVPVTLREELARIQSQGTGADEKREEIRRYLAETLKLMLAERTKALGEPAMVNLSKAVMLQSIDFLWMDHLDQMEHLRDSVRLRAYGQRDPLVEYKNEGLRLFKELQATIRSQVVNTIFKVTLPQQPAASYQQPAPVRQPANLIFSAPSKEALSAQPQPAGIHNPTPKKQQIGRNDPCPCGATHPDGRPKKYKHCHGKNA